MPTFTPPTVDEAPAGVGRLFGRYKLTRGVTVVNNGGVYTNVRYPSQDQLANADAYWLGGYAHTITTDEATALIAAGYGSYIT